MYYLVNAEKSTNYRHSDPTVVEAGEESYQEILRRAIARLRMTEEKAQTLLEYLILIGIVTVVLFAMYHTMKRGIQSVIKITADQIGNQQRADQIEPTLSNAAIVPGPNDQQPVATSGYLVNAYTATRASNQKEVQELQGVVGYSYQETVSTNSNSLTNLGFNPRGGN